MICLAFSLNKISIRTLTLQFYPTQLHAFPKFMYYMFFIFAPSILYSLDIFRDHPCGASCSKSVVPRKTKQAQNFDRLIMIFFPLAIVLWPAIVNIKKGYLLYKYHTTKGYEQLKWKADSKEMHRKAGIVHLTEVCIESTFLSILNWYILLPNFLTEFDLDSAETTNILAAVSFLISIISLTWSYTSYVAEQKDGALALTWAPAGRCILFVSNLLLIFARMNCIVLFMFYFGPGNVYHGMCFLFGHIILMMAIHAYNVLRY